MGTALQIALAYHEAWTKKALDKAMSYIAEDIVCDAPAGRIEGAEAYRAFHGTIRAESARRHDDRGVR